MEKVIAASEANRSFSRILREVSEGGTFTVTSHGRPIARIVPAAQSQGNEAARQRLLERLHNQPAMHLGRFRREDAYD